MPPRSRSRWRTGRWGEDGLRSPADVNKIDVVMQVGRYAKIYHYHIPKCGGTSIAWWLNQHASDRRLHRALKLTRQGDNYPGLVDPSALAEAERLEAPRRRMAFFAADIVSDHTPMPEATPDGAFCFTVLRDPGARIVSKIADWRRLRRHDLDSLDPGVAAIVADAGRLSVARFLKTHGCSAHLFNNHIARALAAFTLNVEARRRTALADLAAIARDNVGERFQFVGISEYPGDTLNRLADLLGFAPESDPPRMNRTDSASALAAEAEEARDVLAELTRFDRELYDHALRLFFARDAAAGRSYDRAAFETRHAAATVGRIDGVASGDDIVFSVRDPLVGSGFHGRDGAGLDGCCVWSGPSPAFVLYMPVPSAARLALRLWVRGYASLSQRDRLRVRVDGVERPHRFEQADGYAEAIAVEVTTQRDFVALEIDVGETATTGEPGTPSFDPRLRGLAFDRYGWRALAE